MALTEAQNQRITVLLQALEPHVGQMTGASPGFVQNQVQRHNQYGDQMFISPKQIAWLEDLYSQYCGPTTELPQEEDPSADYDDPDGKSKTKKPIDDDIPF